MNWYNNLNVKTGHYSLEDQNDRGIVNEKILFLRDALEKLTKLSKGIFQNAREVKSINYELLTHKKISSHPLIKEILINADKVALDNPWKFAQYCDMAKEKIQQQIIVLEKERHDFVENKLPRIMKGLVDNDK